MRGMTILRSLPFSQVAVTGGDGVEYLTTPDPKEVWQAAAATTQYLDIDLGSLSDIDTIFIGFTNAAPDAQWSVYRTTSLAGANPVALVAPTSLRVPGGTGARHHALALLGETATTRFLRIILAQTGAEPIQAGVVMAGQRFDHPYEYKAGRRPIDLSERVDLSGGGFGIGRAAIKSSFRFTFSDLDDAELDTLWQTIKAVGIQHPVLLVEGGDGAVTFDQVHYGLFEQFEAYERDDPADTRWALSMQDWI